MKNYLECDLLSTRQIMTTGKSDEEKRIASEYIERERNWRNEEAKAPERERIADFILEHHGQKEKLRLLSMPSLHWSFENLLVDRCPNRQFFFCGLEWTWGVLELGVPYMPGGRKRPHKVELGIGPIQGFASESLNINSHWLWIEAQHFLTMNRSHKGPRNVRMKFARVYKRMTAIWLDFTSQLCAGVRQCLTHVGSLCYSDKNEVPIAVTVMAARDCHDDDADRVFEINELLNDNPFRCFDLRKSWTYTNNGIPMLTVVGLLIAK